MWESNLLRDDAFRVLFQDWENGLPDPLNPDSPAHDFPDLGDGTTIDPNASPPVVLTFGELFKGIARLPESRKKVQLQKWIELDLRQRFAHRTLNVGFEIASLAGQIQGTSESEGTSLPVIDSLIAATAIQNGMAVVTRNVGDMTRCRAPVINPWEATES